jgi:hypothetical protein
VFSAKTAAFAVVPVIILKAPLYNVSRKILE